MDKKYKLIIIKILGGTFWLLLLFGFMCAGYMFGMVKHNKLVKEHVTEALGKALSDEWNCVDHSMLEVGKLNEQYDLNLTFENSS